MEEEYIIASVKIPICITNGGSNTYPCQDRCHIEFYRCTNLDDFPQTNELESAELLNKFAQFFSDTGQQTQQAAPSSEESPVSEEPPVSEAPPSSEEPPVSQASNNVLKEVTRFIIEKHLPSKQKSFRVYHNRTGNSSRFTKKNPFI